MIAQLGRTGLRPSAQIHSLRESLLGLSRDRSSVIGAKTSTMRWRGATLRSRRKRSGRTTRCHAPIRSPRASTTRHAGPTKRCCAPRNSSARLSISRGGWMRSSRWRTGWLMRVVEREREIVTLSARLDATLEELRERVEEDAREAASTGGADARRGFVEWARRGGCRGCLRRADRGGSRPAVGFRPSWRALRTRPTASGAAEEISVKRFTARAGQRLRCI